ncbi:hypothetical protein HPB47_003211, partial [Ixodes persulcatus]
NPFVNFTRWDAVAANLNEALGRNFSVRGVRDRCDLLLGLFKRDDRTNLRKFRTDPELETRVPSAENHFRTTREEWSMHVAAVLCGPVLGIGERCDPEHAPGVLAIEPEACQTGVGGVAAMPVAYRFKMAAVLLMFSLCALAGPPLVRGSEESLGFEAAFQGECRVDGPCQQICFDLHDGTFECGCSSGYRLSSNGYGCE